MRIRFVFVVSLFIGILLLTACDFVGGTAPSLTPSPAATTVSAAGTPSPERGRPANVTPSGQRTPGAQRTPQAAVTSAPTPVVASVITGTSGIAPTAVPIPNIVIPTLLPAATATGNAPSSAIPAYTPAPLPPIPALPSQVAVTNVEALRGKIVFFSDRGGSYPQLYVMESDGSNQRLCNCSNLLETLVSNEVTSPDKRQYIFVKEVVYGGRTRETQIWAHDNETNEDKPVTGGPPGFPSADYDPVWSPNARHIAWVTETNGFDEIYLYDRTTNENTRLTQSESEWYKHPSFSPDGSQIAFWTNRENAERKQIWVMKLDGSQARNISRNDYNDWDPIWVK